MALALNNLKRVDMPLNKERNHQSGTYIPSQRIVFIVHILFLKSFFLHTITWFQVITHAGWNNLNKCRQM